MKCASCSAEIADKAIVCYRCGAPTAIPEPVRRSAPPRPSRVRLYVLLAILLVVTAIFAFMLWRRTPLAAGRSGLSPLGPASVATGFAGDNLDRPPARDVPEGL